MKKQLIKQVDMNGSVWYHTVYNGIKVTPFTHDEEEAIKSFKEFKPVPPSISVMMEEEVNND
jgi:hypothetical protein